MKYTALQNQRGYSFVEVLVAISILLLGAVGPLTIASKGLNNALYAKEQNTATFLAQEGLESVVLLRNWYALADLKSGSGGATAWLWYSTRVPTECKAGAACGMRLNNTNGLPGLFTCSGDPGNCKISYYKAKGTTRAMFMDRDVSTYETQYTRKLYFSSLSTDAVEVRSEVSWQPLRFGGQTRSVSVETVLYNVYGYEFN